MPPKNSKVWNEDLVRACRARELLCRQQGKARQHLWRDAARTVEAVRKDIYAFSNGRVVNFPTRLKKTTEEVLRRVISGSEPIYPPGYIPVIAGDTGGQGNVYLEDPYLKKIKVRSGAYAILMALYISNKDIMSKNEICETGQAFCDEPMHPNWHQGRAYAGWSSISTLINHNLVLRNERIIAYREAVGGFRSAGGDSFVLTNEGRKFIQALFETRPETYADFRRVRGIDVDELKSISNQASVARAHTEWEEHQQFDGSVLSYISKARAPSSFDASSFDLHEGKVLGSSEYSPAKRLRSGDAAREAALLRQAIHLSKGDQKLSDELEHVVSPPKYIRRDNEFSRTIIDLCSDEPYHRELKVTTLDSCDDESRMSQTRKQKVNHCSSSFRDSHTVIVLDDSDDDDALPPSIFVSTGVGTASINAKSDRRMKILIDSRERDRNATPRLMRIALTQMLSKNGFLSQIWPSSWKLPVVEEATLRTGDFSFHLIEPNDCSYEIPVCVERKRVSDLVSRSVKKDHWKQLHKMSSVGQDGGSCILIIEGDIRTADRFTAYGSPSSDVPSRNDFTVHNQDELVRFLGRAIMSFECVHFIQTSSEVATYEAIAAVAMVTSYTYSDWNGKRSAIRNFDKDHFQLSRELMTGGIPQEIACCVADEVGSIDHLKSIYQRIEDESLWDGLLLPIVEDIVRKLGSKSSSHSWSSAIHKVVYSTLKNPSVAKKIYDECKGLVDDEAKLLGLIHTGSTADEAVDAVTSATVVLSAQSHRRIVSIEVTTRLDHYFKWAQCNEDSFYRIHRRLPSIKVGAIPVAVIRTASEHGASRRLFVFVLEGGEFVRRMRHTMNVDPVHVDFLQVSRSVACTIVTDCHASDHRSGDKRILLLNGLQSALDQAAKHPGYILQSRALSYMILTNIMLVHNMIVIQGTRLTNDSEMILKQLILSCYQFQLLTQPIPAAHS